MPDPRVRNPVEIATRRAAELAGNSAMTPQGSGPGSDDSGAAMPYTPPVASDGDTVMAWRVGDPVNDDHFYILP